MKPIKYVAIILGFIFALIVSATFSEIGKKMVRDMFDNGTESQRTAISDIRLSP